ncbi:hypothetical protein MRB53_030437 [Persea americana]|uniref:Uncharacterized protein n=1 Tax=Persea americana TaxID=3435 RepID=A0ACC2KLB1_PERAE|nr:hypothetical protein MRB53_030437 [Persea americana]
MASQTALLNLYSNQGKWRETFLLYLHMRTHGFQPNTYTFPLLLKPSPPLPLGQSIHADATKRGYESDPFVINAVIAMYSRCRRISLARQLFDEMPQPNTVSWNATISSFFRAGYCDAACELLRKMPYSNVITWSAVIAGYTQNGRSHDALLVFRQMIRESTSADDGTGTHLLPNSNTIASVLSACVQLRALSFGEQVHCLTIKISTYTENDVFVGSVLIDLYGRCGFMGLARHVFNSMVEKCVVAWSILIAAHVENSCPSDAIETFKQMVYGGTTPNHVTFTTVITACAHMPDFLLGKALHCFIAKRLEESDIFISTALIDMYSKCSSLKYAHRVFEKDNFFLGHGTTPMWNAMISGYVDNNCLDDAWCVTRCLNWLPSGGPKPNVVTMAIVLPLCTKSASLRYGKEVHCCVLKTGFDEEVFVANGLLDMYSKCGEIQSAERLFKKMPVKNRISWTTMIDGYGTHGDGDAAIELFECMVREKDVKPDSVTFVALISACSHAGLVEEGLGYFKAMQCEYGIIPMEENYSCVIDLLARAGHIGEAKELIATMPMKPGASVWGALLSACRIHGHVHEAELASQRLLELEPKEAGFHTLLSNIYAENGRIDGVVKVRSAMREMGLAKRRGCSWLETKEGIHGFVVGHLSQFNDREYENEFGNLEVAREETVNSQHLHLL